MVDRLRQGRACRATAGGPCRNTHSAEQPPFW